MKAFKISTILFFTSFVLLAQDFNSQSRVEAYLQNHLNELNLTQDDILDYQIYREYKSEKTELIHVFLQQKYQGIPIHKAEIRLHYHKDKSWIKTQNNFVKDLNNMTVQSDKILNEIEAIQFACSELGITYSRPKRISKKVAPVKLSIAKTIEVLVKKYKLK